MNAKQVVAKTYELFGNGEMEAWIETIDENVVFTLPGDEHPLSGIYKGKQAMLEVFAKIPETWDNFKVEPEFMIAEGNKVFTKVNAKADGMDTIFGHYAEYSEEGKLIHFMTFDDTLSMFNAMK